MSDTPRDIIELRDWPVLDRGTMVLALGGWMDGGDVSTGTVKRLVHLLEADEIAEIDPESFYIYNFPGSMEMASLFRPHIKIDDGMISAVDMPSNTFYCHEPANLALFVGKEPNLRWRTFGQCIVHLAHKMGIERVLFVGSFGGSVPHTREPRLYATCSDAELLAEMEQYGFRHATYEGPGSFITYLMMQAESARLQMVSLVAEIPGYLQGTNPASIEAVTRRLAKILKLPLDLDSLRSASTTWELQVSSAVDQDDGLAQTVRSLEEEYDDELLEQGFDEAEE